MLWFYEMLTISALMNWKIRSCGRNVRTIGKHINNASKEEVIIQLSQILRQLLQMEKRYLLNIYDTCNIINLEFMEETMMDKKTQKIGVICSIVQIILSIICLIYNAINQENIIIWVLFLCSGFLLLSSNISRNNKKEDE